MPEDQGEPISTKTKVVAGAAIGVAIPAAVGVAKKLAGGGEEESGRDEQSQRRRPRPQRTQQRSRTTSKASGTRSKSARSKTTREPTREELYRQATRLKIEGRSRMSKTELKRAVGRARSK